MCAALLCGCGDRVPESKAARAAGDAPKQAVERATGGVDAALQKGADRAKDDDTK
ncbi:MAG: hypothetical protein JNM90_06390 [Burkholderiales bacterium]|nr:hypothetical protein [Burkholderiales bacterium]